VMDLYRVGLWKSGERGNGWYWDGLLSVRSVGSKAEEE